MVPKTELTGWKEIASYIHRSVRTAQRWEAELGLPVRRIRTPGGETVYALAAELDAWKIGVRQVPAGRAALDEANGNGAPVPSDDDHATPGEAAAPARPTWFSARRGVLLAGGAVGLVLATAAWFVLRPAVPAHAAVAHGAAPAVIDGGPWPTWAHDMRRGNQSPLPGPAAPVEATLLFDSASPDTWIVEMVSTRDGMLVVPECGRILALDRATRALRWQRDLVAGGHKVLPLGLTVDPQGQVLATGIECPDVAGGLRTGMFVVRPDGADLALVPQGSTYSGPAIGPDGAVYTLDESTLLRAYQPWSSEKWMTDLAGRSNRGLAIDSRGNLYAGTDGGRMHQASLWSIRPQDGEIRWRAAGEDLGLPAIGGDDTVYVAARTGTVHAFTPEGQERWARAVGAISSGRPLAIGRSGTIYVHATTDLVALRPDGTRKWTFTPGRGTTEATPILDRDENVYAAFGPAVYCLAARDGRARWSLPIAEPDVIILGEAGTLYVVSQHRRVYVVTSAAEGTAGTAGTPSPGRAPR